MRVIVWKELFGPYIGGIELVHQADLPFRCGHEVVVATRQGSPNLPTKYGTTESRSIDILFPGAPLPTAMGFTEARKQLSNTETFNFAHKQAG